MAHGHTATVDRFCYRRVIAWFTIFYNLMCNADRILVAPCSLKIYLYIEKQCGWRVRLWLDIRFNEPRHATKVGRFRTSWGLV